MLNTGLHIKSHLPLELIFPADKLTDQHKLLLVLLGFSNARLFRA